MHHTARNYEALSGRKFYNAALHPIDEDLSLGAPFLQIDEKHAFDHVEKLIVVIVFVPVILPFKHANAHHRSIHLAQCLVEPFELAGVRN
jgi:hypothetical protein